MLFRGVNTGMTENLLNVVHISPIFGKADGIVTTQIFDFHLG